MKNNCIFLLVMFSLVSCSSSNHSAISSYASSLDSSENIIKKERELENSSDLMHYFITAELAYESNDLELALKHYYKIRKISQVPVAKVESKITYINLLNGNYQEAAESLENLLNVEDKAENYSLLAGIYHSLDKIEARDRYIFDGLNKYPKDESLMFYALIYDYVKNQDINKTSDFILKNKNILPIKLSYHFLARLYEYKKNYDFALKYYRLALQEDDSNMMLVEDMARVFLYQNNYKQAKYFLKSRKIETTLLEVLKDKLNENLPEEQWKNYLDKKLEIPTDLETINLLRFLYVQKHIVEKNKDKALNDLFMLLADNPEFTEARFLLASILVTTGKINEGIKEFEKVQPEDKLYLRSRAYSSLILKKNKQYTEALRLIKEALEFYPEKINLHKLHIDLQRESKNLKNLEEAIEDALDEYPENQSFLFQYAGVSFELGKDSKAFSIVDDILEINPDNIDALNFLAYMYSVNGENLDEALEKINVVLEKSPGNPYYLDTLAWIYYKQKKYHEAKEVQKKVIKLVPDDAVMLEHYADILLALGDEISAKDYYLQSLRESKDADPSIEIDELKKRLEKKLN